MFGHQPDLLGTDAFEVVRGVSIVRQDDGEPVRYRPSSSRGHAHLRLEPPDHEGGDAGVTQDAPEVGPLEPVVGLLFTTTSPS